MRGKKGVVFLSLLLSFGLTGCGLNSVTEKIINNAENTIISDEKVPKDSGIGNMIVAGNPDITVNAIKKKYGVENAIEIAPFYNISQNTNFVFHFNSKVSPINAITVHTNPQCNLDSMVYQINDGYYKDNGTEIIVKPGSPILNSSDRGKLDNYNWGYAPIYYLCIHYDLNATETTKLEKPIIVPFTIKSDISTPNVKAIVNQDGQFEIMWNPIEDAVKYNIYEANAVKENSQAREMNRSECAYIGDHLTLLTSVDSDTTSFTDFNNDNTGNTMKSQGYVVNQNFYSLGTYYITAVDKDGNESLFSMAIEGWKHNENLPKSFEDQSIFEKNNGIATVLPQVANIKMCNAKTMKFPISYTKLSEENGNAIYEYSIEGTLLQGTITYHNDEQNYPNEIISNQKRNTAMYNINNSINIIPENTVKTKDESPYVDIAVDVLEYIDGLEKIEFDENLLYQRADLEATRIVTDGIYPSDSNPLDIFSEELTTESKNEITQENNGNKLNGLQPINFSNENNEEEEGKEEEIVDETEQLNADNETKENSASYETEFTVFADSAEEEYLALSMIAAEEQIPLAAFPNLQNTEYLLDVLYKVIYQNPYIISSNAFSYDSNNAMLYLNYSNDKDTIKTQQFEIKKKVEYIVQNIYKEGMTDEEKMLAIWTFLENNSVYDTAACEMAEKNDFKDVTGFEDSFSAYGVLCKKIGVCQSYMYATKLLCNEMGIECLSLTGYLQNTLPHGWNIVKLDGNWYWIDTTNNKTNTNVPYFIYETSYDFASESWNYVLDDYYELNTNLDFAKTSDMSHDFYYSRGLYATSHNEIVNIIKDKVKEYNGLLYIKCSFIPNINDDDFVKGIEESLINAGYSYDELSNTIFGNISQIMIIDVHGTTFNN